MARRIEGQLSRDYSFRFVSWNYVFRTAINLSHDIYSYADTLQAGSRLTAADIEAGAVRIRQALKGEYTDSAGKKQLVRGDLAKVRLLPNSGPAAEELLKQVDHIPRKMPGTQEARRSMRMLLTAMRYVYGVPIFVIFAPTRPTI